jgi:hypothetical protein
VKYRRKGEGWGKWGSSGLWVLSNHPIDWVKSHAYRYCAGLDCLANKGVMLVSDPCPGLPTPVEIADTHLNSNGASGVPRKRNPGPPPADRGAGAVHGGRPHAGRAADRRRRLQHHARSPDRFDYVMSDYPFDGGQPLVPRGPASCDTQISYDGDAPWLDTQDLIGFLNGDAVAYPQGGRGHGSTAPANRCCPTTTATR